MIETERLRLLPWPVSALDLEALARELGIAVPQDWRPDVMDILPAGPPPYCPYAVVRGAELVGSAGYTGPPDPGGAVEIGYEVAPAHRRNGYATEAARALVALALGQPDVNRVIASANPENLGSVRVLELAGFERAGMRGDELFFELRP